MNVTYDYQGRIVLVTGGGSGIGLASSRAFAVAGALVIVADLSPDNGNQAVEVIRSAGGKAEFRRVDVANESEVVALVGQGPQALDLAGHGAPLERVAQRHHEALAVERLLDEIVGARLDGAHGVRERRVSRDHDDRRQRVGRLELRDPLDRLEP